MNINEPSKDVIERLKATHSDRSLHLVEAVDGEDVYTFVMTGPNDVEYKKYVDEVIAGREAKTEALQISTIRAAVTRAVLAQIRYPDRDECQRIFSLKPAMIENFTEQLKSSAGANVEVRSKKL